MARLDSFRHLSDTAKAMNTRKDTHLTHVFQQAVQQVQETFWQLHDGHAPRLLAFLRARTASMAEAEEIHQDVWMRVWRALSKHPPEENFRAWLYDIARQCLVDRARSQAIGPHLLTNETNRDWVQTLLASEADILVVVRRRLLGRSPAEIAAELGMAPAEVRRLFETARKILEEPQERAA